MNGTRFTIPRRRRSSVLAALLCAFSLGTETGAQPASVVQESIGSTRNSRVAHVMPADPEAARKVTLTLLVGEMPAETVARLSKEAPNVRIIAGLNRQSALAHAQEADGVAAHLLTPEFLKNASKLTWVLSFSAGVDRYVGMEGIAGNDRIVMTNSRGVHGPTIADHAFAMLLSLTRNLGEHAKNQSDGKWGDQAEPANKPMALQGKTMLVIGIGGIGTEVAKRANGFGMRVIATRRTDAPAPAFVEKVGKPEDLKVMLGEADVVAICVPLTKETTKLFNSEMFGAMKPGAYLINVARGKIVDTDALIAALKGGRLAGACLDVTDPEPLPSGHPLWKEPRVVITPHVSAEADLTDQREWALIEENIRRFGKGEPLLNVVDVKSGY